MFDNRTEYADDEPVYYYCNEGYTMHENSSDGTAVCENGTRDIPTCISDSKLIILRETLEMADFTMLTARFCRMLRC